MQSTSAGAKRQPDLIPRSMRPTIPIAADHRLVQVTYALDWSELEERAQQIRAGKLKNAAGRPPHLQTATLKSLCAGSTGMRCRGRGANPPAVTRFPRPPGAESCGWPGE
jgi:hypothetical protein